MNARIPKVTRFSGGLLHMKGRLDGRRGEGVVDAYVDKLLKRLRILEAEAVQETENRLHPSRDKASSEYFPMLRTEVPAPHEKKPEHTDADVRANRRLAQETAAAETRYRAAETGLMSIAECVIHEDTLLRERILQLRSDAFSRIEVYVAGVRHRLKEYTAEAAETDDRAWEIYVEKHRLQNEALTRFYGNTICKEAV